MKNVLVIVTLSALLSACAGISSTSRSDVTTPVSVAATEEFTSEQVTPENPAAKSSAQPIEDLLPAVDLSEEVFFKLVSAEIAYQRGAWQTAYITILGLAQQTRDPRLARRATEMALGAKQPGEALAAIRLWRELAPHSEEATQYYLSFIMLSDSLAEARPIFEQRLKVASPKNRSLLIFQIQRLLARAKDKAAAFSLLEEVLAPYQLTIDAHLALAHSAFAKGDVGRARAEARAALSAKPDSELAVLTLAQVTPDKNDAAKLMAEFLTAHPKARDVRMAYARMLVDLKQYDKARGEFETLLKAQPQDLTVLYALGILGTQTNNLKAAETYLTAYLKELSIHPSDERDPTQALLILAQIAEERNDNEAALKWLAQIEPGEAYLNAQIKRAQIIAKRGDLAAARKLLSELQVEGDREQAQIIVAEAQILREANQTQAAITVLKAGLVRFPNNTDLLYDYAMVAEKINQLDIMESTLRKIMELAPNNQHAYNALGYSFAERNIRLQEAFTLIEKALKLAPEDPFIMDSMGWVHYRLGNLKEAESLLRRSYELRPDAEIAVHLGEVLWVKGQKAEAQKLWRDARAKDPQNDTLKNTLARLNVSL